MLNFQMRFVLVLTLLAGGLVALSESPAIAKDDSPEYPSGQNGQPPIDTGDIFVMAQSGQIGLWSIQNYYAWCIYHSAPTEIDVVGVQFDLFVEVNAKARGIYSNQEVSVQGLLYERLENGSYKSILFPFSQGLSSRPFMANHSTSPNRGDWDGSLSFGSNHPMGPDYFMAIELTWYEPGSSNVEGWVEVGLQNYMKEIDGGAYVLDQGCSSPWPPTVDTSSPSGTVNSKLNYTLHGYPLAVVVDALWDGEVIDGAAINGIAEGHGDFKIPSASLGPHTIEWKYGKWVATTVFTVKPNVAIANRDSPKARGQKVNLMLTGFGPNELVYIRWKQGEAFRQVNHVKTDENGSAMVVVHVPKWVEDGKSSIRGDGSLGHAQTNAVIVSGGPLVVESATPSPSPSQSATDSAQLTAIPTAASDPGNPKTRPETATSFPTAPFQRPRSTTPTPTQTPVARATRVVAPTQTPTPEPTRRSTRP